MNRLMLVLMIMATAGCSTTRSGADAGWKRHLRGILVGPFPDPQGQYAICGAWPGYICSGGRTK